MGCLYVCLGMLYGFVSVQIWGQALSTVQAKIINARGLAVKNCNKRPHRGQKILHRSQDRDKVNTNVFIIVNCFATIVTMVQNVLATMWLLSKFFDLLFSTF